MMEQYLKIKDENQDSLVFFRLGDFYEMFFDDAVTASSALDLTLTGRDCGLKERAPMCGVPYHALDGYLAKLTQQGYKVAICEQMTLAEDAKGIVDRQVVRIVTPGTIMDEGILANETNNYLMSICYKRNVCGVSWADITTGELNHAFFDSQIPFKLNDLLLRISPSEIICNERMYEMSKDLSVVKYDAVCKFQKLGEKNFDLSSSLEILQQQLDEKSFSRLKEKDVCIGSCGALISYIEMTQKRRLPHINRSSFESDFIVMAIDANARKTLELVGNAVDGKNTGSLLWLIDKTSSCLGTRTLKKWLEQPSIDETIINQRLEGVEEIFENIVLRENLQTQLKKIRDIERIAGRVSYGNISPADCLELCQSLNAIPKIKENLSSAKSPILKNINQTITQFDKAESLLSKAINPNANKLLKEGTIIQDGFDAELDEYRNAKLNAVNIINQLEVAEKEETGIKNLKISYNKVFGYYIEVLKSQLDLVPFRYTRKQTISTGERFITEELKAIEFKILNAADSATIREIKLFNNIVISLKTIVSDLLTTANAISTLDCIVSNSVAAYELNFNKPKIGKNIEHIKITEGRHCVVEKFLQGEPFVPNDTFLDEKDSKIMLITGPNMAGKSVFMRQVALITILAHIGSFVPAKSAEISITDRIFTRVGASDDLSSGRSTFMVEMTEVSYILGNVTDHSLLLLDEIGRGTSTFDGLSIAWSIIEYLSKTTSAKVLFSTHYHELTELEGVLPGVKNYKLTVREINNTIIFLRKLMRGGANKSFGIEVASIAGLPDIVVARSKEILKMLENADIAKKSTLNNQISIFSSTTNNEISRILKDINTDEISARQAFDILIDLKEKVMNDVNN